MAGKREFHKLGKCVSPRGVASWAFLNEAQPDDQGREKFRITLFMDPAADETKEFTKKLKGWRAEAAKLFGKKPADMTMAIKEADADTIERSTLTGIVEPGWIQMEFNCTKKNGDATPPIVDGSRNPTDEPWKGDICRVQANAVAYNTGGKRGVKLYLAGVQVLERNSKGGASYGTDLFEEEVPAEDDNDSMFSGTDDLPEQEIEDDDIPF